MKFKMAFDKFLFLLKAERKEISLLYFFAVLGGLIQLTIPLGIQSIISLVMGARMVSSLYVLIILIIIGIALVGLLNINTLKLSERIQQRFFSYYGILFSKKIPTLNVYYYDRINFGEKVNRFFDTLNLQKGVAKILLDLPTAIVQIVIGIILLSLYNSIFIVFGIFFIFLLWLIIRITATAGLETSLQESNAKYNFVSWLEEMGNAIVLTKRVQKQTWLKQNSDKLLGTYLINRNKHFKVLLYQYYAFVLFKIILSALLLSTGVYLLVNQQLNIGEFVAIEIVIFMLIAAVEKIIKRLDSFYDILTALEKLATITHAQSENDGLIDIDNDTFKIHLKDLSFKYKDEKNIFYIDDISLPTKGLVRFVAEQGRGLTSLIKILSFHISDFEGVFLINDVPLSSYNLGSLRDNIGVLDSRNEIINDTVINNILIGRKIDLKTIMATADRMGISSFLSELPDGFDSLLPINGQGISSGLIMKILLLRAFVGDAKVVLIDDIKRVSTKNDFKQIWDFLEEEAKHKLIVYTSETNMNFPADFEYKLDDNKFFVQC